MKIGTHEGKRNDFQNFRKENEVYELFEKLNSKNRNQIFSKRNTEENGTYMAWGN